jgi:hypothetical protein
MHHTVLGLVAAGSAFLAVSLEANLVAIVCGATAILILRIST